MDETTTERIASYEQKAANARARARTAHSAADTYSARFQGGQPILRGHSSERGARRDRNRSDNAMRRAIEAEKAAKYWDGKAEAARRREKQKNDPGVIQRRHERNISDLIAQQGQFVAQELEAVRASNHVAKAKAAEEVMRLQREIEEARADLAKAREELEEAGVKVWGKADFAKGDFAFRRGIWWEIKSANKKTVTAGAVIGYDNARFSIKGSPVYRLADNPYSWTDTIPYTEIKGRISAADMNAKLPK